MNSLEIGGGENPSFHPNFDIRELPTVDTVGKWEDGLPFESGSFDLVYSSHTLEHLLLKDVPFALHEVYRVLTPEGKAIIDLPDLQALMWHFTNNLPDLGENEIKTIYGEQDYPENVHKSGFSPQLLMDLLQKVGFKVTIENRMGFNFRTIAYKNPINWIVKDKIEYRDLIYNYVVLTRETDRDWNSILNFYKAEDEKFESAGCMSAMAPKFNFLALTLSEFLTEQWDEVYLEHDVTSQKVFDLLYDAYQKDSRVSLIFNADIVGLVTAWNRLFASTRSKYVFVIGSDDLIYHPFKDPIIEHFNKLPDVGWIGSPSANRLFRFLSYSSGLRAEALKKVGYLSPEFNPCHVDDFDLAMKLQEAGYSTLACAHVGTSHLACKDTTCSILHTTVGDDHLSVRQWKRYKKKWGNRIVRLGNNVPLCIE